MIGRRLGCQSVPYRLYLLCPVVFCSWVLCQLACAWWKDIHTDHLLLPLTHSVDNYSVLIGNLYLSTGGPTLPPIFLLKMVDICKTLYLLFVSAPKGVVHIPTAIVGHTVGRGQTVRGVFRESSTPQRTQYPEQLQYITSLFLSSIMSSSRGSGRRQLFNKLAEKRQYGYWESLSFIKV